MDKGAHPLSEYIWEYQDGTGKNRRRAYKENVGVHKKPNNHTQANGNDKSNHSVKNKNSGSVKKGDETQLLLFITLLLGAGATATTIAFRKRRKEKW